MWGKKTSEKGGRGSGGRDENGRKAVQKPRGGGVGERRVGREEKVECVGGREGKIKGEGEGGGEEE